MINAPNLTEQRDKIKYFLFDSGRLNFVKYMLQYDKHDKEYGMKLGGKEQELLGLRVKIEEKKSINLIIDGESFKSFAP